MLVGSFRLDRDRRELRSASGALVPLRPQTMAVLLHLAGRVGQLVTKDELFEAVWADVVVTDDSLVKCIAEIRHALGDEGPRWLRTEPKRGYRLLAESWGRRRRQPRAAPSTPFRIASSTANVR